MFIIRAPSGAVCGLCLLTLRVPWPGTRSGSTLPTSEGVMQSADPQPGGWWVRFVQWSTSEFLKNDPITVLYIRISWEVGPRIDLLWGKPRYLGNEPRNTLELVSRTSSILVVDSF